jgi:hypothetical protein
MKNGGFWHGETTLLHRIAGPCVSQQMSTTQKISEIVFPRPEQPGTFAFYGTFDSSFFLR